MDWIVSPQNLSPNVTIFGHSAFKRVIKIRWGQKGGAPVQQDWCPYKKRKKHQIPLSLSLRLSLSLCLAHRRKVLWRHSEKVVVCKPGREVSPDTNPEGTLILDLQLVELWRMNLCHLSPLFCGILSWLSQQTHRKPPWSQTDLGSNRCPTFHELYGLGQVT